MTPWNGWLLLETLTMRIEELMSEQGYENVENQDRYTYYAEKDGKEYMLIVDTMKEDGEVKFEITPFEKGTKEALN